MAKDIYRIANMFFFPTGSWGFFIALSVLAMLILCTYIVAWTGGTHNSYVHCIYLPIIFSGSSFGVKGGISSGMAATLLVGPLMPASFDPLIYQHYETWLVRGVFFNGVGFITGMSASIFRAFLQNQQMRLLRDGVTRLLNLKGLKYYLDDPDVVRPSNMSIFVMEINRLQDIEKALGPDDLQHFLRQIADKIKVIACESIHIGHMETGGFVFVTSDKAKSLELIDKCHKLLSNRFIVNDIPLFVEIYFGLAVAISSNEPVSRIIRKAKIAAIKAQNSNQIYNVFDDEDDAASRRSVQLIHDLSEAITNNDLILYYQPKVDLKTQDVFGFEVLVRWPHVQFGMISPDEFIPLIEQTLLINPFTKWLFDQALNQFAKWRQQDVNFTLAINFSMANFQDSTVLDYLFLQIDKYNIPPELIEIEVTETAVTDNIDDITQILKSLRQHGLSVAIDDFGTGQSSLQYLCNLPIDTIKIDKTFTQSMLDNPAAEAIIRSSILLSHELNLTVVTEGIETEEQLLKLQKLGCDIGQGYLFSKPMPAESVLDWISVKKASTSEAIAVKNTH